jgi:hypothetical protein
MVNAVIPMTPSAKDNSKRWSRDICLGCRHVTNPPHRRHDCPYREFPGWCAHGIPTAPLPIPKVALLTDENDDVSIVKGKVGPSINPNLSRLRLVWTP